MNKGTSLLELLCIVGILCGLVLPFVIFGLWWWAGMMALIGIVFGAFEYIRWAITGKTLSQDFWKWSKEHRWQAWIIIIIMAVAWALLLIHLSCKLW